jgi:hypothetical protein
MYQIIQWTEPLRLTEFYAEANRRGFVNNASRRMLIDSLSKEREWALWILYYNAKAVGSVAAHSFDEVMGPNSYRIATRTCVFTDMLPTDTLRTRNQIITHQHVTSQFLIPACIDWAPTGSNLYITTNENIVGTQRLVHRVFAPAMEESGQIKKIKEVNYRGSFQTVWQLFPDKFYSELEKYPKWS